MLDATQRFDTALTAERLFDWHASLFPGGRSAAKPIHVGAWRDDGSGPMQVVSGSIGRERVHFQAPAAPRIDGEVQTFLEWFNADQPQDWVLKAGLAHLWFITIHPFDDGNGRIARAIADMALAHSEQSPQRFYSMSSQIRTERRAYYEMLEATQKGGLNVTAWLVWFLGCLDRAITASETVLAEVLTKARFWDAHDPTTLNDRQRLVINRMLDGMEGKLTTSKWALLAKCSADTALRDLVDLVGKGILIKDASGGRSTSYSLRAVSRGN